VSTTITYKGWISVSPPKRGRDHTVIVSPGRFFYRPKKHIIAEKMAVDSRQYGPFVNVRMWAHYTKIEQESFYFSNSYMGIMSAHYDEVSNSEAYTHSNQFINISSFDFLEELAGYHHHYCIIEVTYNDNEFDMVSHEAELILLRY
jgi:hypothetical protein